MRRIIALSVFSLFLVVMFGCEKNNGSVVIKEIELSERDQLLNNLMDNIKNNIKESLDVKEEEIAIMIDTIVSKENENNYQLFNVSLGVPKKVDEEEATEIIKKTVDHFFEEINIEGYEDVVTIKIEKK